MQLVELSPLLPGAILDLRYKTARNITGAPLYEADFTPRLAPKAAAALQQVARDLADQKLRLVLWDAYRPEPVQQKLRAAGTGEPYVLETSQHCLGLAVDVTLADQDGDYLDMGTDHDDFSPAAHADAAGLTAAQRTNRGLLAARMQARGFVQWPFEWWHFDFKET